MSNPYLLSTHKPRIVFSWKAELKRLLGSPKRFILTVCLMVMPLLLAISGGIDLAQSGLYSLSHQSKTDNRREFFFLDCVQKKVVCGSNPEWGNKNKLRFWTNPPFLPQSPYTYGGLFVLALLSFVSIGNPRARRIGSVMREVVGVKRSEKAIQESAEPGTELHTLPDLEPEPNHNWIIGGVVERDWLPDPGLFKLKKSNRSQPYTLNTNILRTNLLIVAPPGSGKTSSIFKPFIQFARENGVSALFFDSKGDDFDPALFDHNFDITSPDKSFKLNLYSGRTPSQAGEQLGEALIPQLSNDKKYFSDVAKYSMASLVAAHFAVTRTYPELTQLLIYLKSIDEMSQLQNQLSLKLGEENTEARRLVAGVQSVLDLAQMKGDLLGNLRNALQPLTVPEIAPLLVSGNTGIRVRELVDKTGLVRLGLPVAEYPDVAPIIGRLILTQFNYAVLSQRVNKGHFKVACVDESHNFITASIAKGMAQARSNNAGFMLALQALSQVPDRSLLDTIFAASGTKVVMPGVGDEDAERFSRTIGELELPYISTSTSVTRTTGSNTTNSTSRGSEFEMFGGKSGTESRNSLSRGSGTSQGKSKGETTGMRPRLRRLFLPSELRYLPQYHAVVESSDTFGRRWIAQVVDMSQLSVERLKVELEERDKKGKKGKGNESGIPDKPPTALLPTPTAQAKVELSSLFRIVFEGAKPMDNPTSVQEVITKPPEPIVKVDAATPTVITVVAEPIFTESVARTEPLEREPGQDMPNQLILYPDETSEILKILKGEADVPYSKIEKLAALISQQGRTKQDLRRLVEYIRYMPRVKHRGNYLAALIERNDWPNEEHLLKAKQKALDSVRQKMQESERD